jgi:periplasmic mercuric ion binding protein
MMKNLVLWIGLVIVTMPGCGKSAGEKQSLSSNSINVATIQLPTLKCKTCVRTIKTALASVDGIESAEVNLVSKSATVKFVPAKLDIGKIELAISQAGYDADNVKRDSVAYENLAECCK